MLENKVIFLYSPQAWGKMRLSKHHYAIELVKRGNTVYYIETPENSNRRVRVSKQEEFQGLYIVKSGTMGVLNRHIRMKFPALFNLLIKLNTSKIVRKINVKPDVVWSFDLNGFINLDVFPDAIKIAQPVDFVYPKNHIRAKKVDYIFSVAEEILEPLKIYCKNTYFVNHGVSEKLIEQQIIDNKNYDQNSVIKIAYVGNLLRNDIAHDQIIEVIKSHKEFEFNFIGNSKVSNISSSISDKSVSFITRLKSFPNVKLLGVLDTTELSKSLVEMDAFMICYDEERDMCKGTNYHKVLEYIATGKVLISNHVTTYENLGLFEMTEKNKAKEEYKALFKKVTSNLSFYNSESLQQKRIEFAKQHSYQKQVNKIDELLNLSTY